MGRVSRFNDFIGRFPPATKPRPRKLANFIDRLTSPLELSGVRQEIWANAHETRDNIILISCAGCLGVSPVISVKIHSLSVHCSLKSQKNTKNFYFGVQGCSRSSILVPAERLSTVLVMISSKSLSISNRSHARRPNSVKMNISYGVPLFDAIVRGESPHPAARNLFTRN